MNTQIPHLLLLSLEMTIALIILSFAHAVFERRNNLSAFLADCVGIKRDQIPGFLPWTLFTLALAGTAGPLTLLVIRPDLQTQTLSFLIGALIGDAFSTHLIPSLIVRKLSPGIVTAVIYIAGAIHIYRLENFEINFNLAIAGLMFFVSLWPGMLLMKGLLKSNNAFES